jgi:hypothetical protein
MYYAAQIRRIITRISPLIFLNAGLINLADQIKISLLLKIQWEQQHYLCTKIVYNVHTDAQKRSLLDENRQGYLLKKSLPKLNQLESSRKAQCFCWMHNLPIKVTNFEITKG